MPTPPPTGWVRVSSTDPPVTVICRLSDVPPVVDSGYGGWNEVARPRKRPLTTWGGKPPLHLTLGLLLDGFAERPERSVERQVAMLEKLGQVSSSAGEPPVIKVLARGAAIPYQQLKWVIQDMQYGDAIMNSAGNRTRQAMTLSLIQYVEDVYLAAKYAATLRRQKKAAAQKRQGAAQKRVTAKKSPRVSKKPVAKKRVGPLAAPMLPVALDVAVAETGQGETLVAIAARELGDPDRWIEIAELNGLRDPTAVEPGQVIRLP